MSDKKKVIQYDDDGNLIRRFDSIQEAQAYMKITHISTVCRGKRKHDGGYRWRYANPADALRI